MPTPEELEDLARQLDDRAEELRVAAIEARALAAKLRGLPGQGSARTIRSVDVNTQGMSSAVKRGAARATRKHPAQERFYKAGVTITAVAEELRETRARVSAWMADGEANRPIPRRHADYLKTRYGVAVSAWKRIAE